MNPQLDPVLQIGECIVGELSSCPHCHKVYPMHEGVAWYIGIHDDQYKYLYADTLACLLFILPMEEMQ